MNVVLQQIERAQDAVVSGLITREELARRAGISPSTTRHMREPHWNPTAATLSAIVTVLDQMQFRCCVVKPCNTEAEAID